MKFILFVTVLFSVAFCGCEKDQDRKLLGAYFKYTINGKETVINDETGLSSNVFDCTIKGDTSLIINVAKVYEGAGFVIKNPAIVDGTYTLDSLNKGYYTNPNDQKRYYTTNKYKGTVTIKRGTFQAKDLLNTLEGTFTFQAVDTTTGTNFSVLNGSFLMERKETD